MRALILRAAIVVGTCWLFSASACGGSSSGNCTSQKVGSQALAAASKQWITDQNQEVVLFESAQGDQYRFNKEVEYRFNSRSCVEYLCEAFSDPYKPTPCKYYETESYRNIYRGAPEDTLIIELVLSIENYAQESTLFYDFFTAHMSGIGPFTRGQVVTHKHSAGIDVSTIYAVQQPLEYKASFQAGGQTFNDVYLTTDAANHHIVIQKTQGLVAFELEGVYYFKQ